MNYVVQPSRFEREWIVETFQEDGDGAIWVTAFSGPKAKARAFEYVSWTCNQEREPIAVSPCIKSRPNTSVVGCGNRQRAIPWDVSVEVTPHIICQKGLSPYRCWVGSRNR